MIQTIGPILCLTSFLISCTPKPKAQGFYSYKKGISVDVGIDSSEVREILNFFENESVEIMSIQLLIRSGRRSYSIMRIWCKIRFMVTG